MADQQKIKKLLVANRSEIACRIIRGAKDVGISTVAIYSDLDRQAAFVELADEAYSLGGDTTADTYLNIDKIISIAKKSGANAIHPGYGFLSENAAFAKAVIEADLIWIGPSPAAIEALGDKVTARKIATEVGAPLVPGSDGPVPDGKAAVAFAEKFGLPIAIKAAFGGGGRGMKVARSLEEIPELFESATREATAAFGRGECFVERYLEKPRHVEAQVLADKYGKVIVVGTRDCSVQRRFQKLIEEAPAPYLTEQQTQQIYDSAKAICQKIGYEGAGTVEYLVGADGLVSFLEVNTRLQVEHPVTEETTGIDLVLQQFKIAEGQALEFASDPVARGHAIEFRINGEDPTKNFLPNPGIISTLKVPEGPGVRFDSGIKTGDVISGQYDSMLAKLIVKGEDRINAINRAKRVLSEMEITGITTVLPFDRAILTDKDFVGNQSGFKVHTKWIETEWVNKLTEEETTAAHFDDSANAEQLIHTAVEVDGKRIVVAIPKEVIYGTSQKNKLTGDQQVYFTKPKNRVKDMSGKGAATGNQVVSPMQGTIVKIAVEEGNVVKAGDLLLVVEAMKMENPITAHKDGTVTDLQIAVSDTVTAGSSLLELID